MSKMLAFDFGASGGKCFLGILENDKLEINEVYRFPNDPVKMNKHLHWDILRLFYEVKQGILKCKNECSCSDIDSIGIDTWGVDFGIIDGEGELVGNPVHYRDDRTNSMIERCFDIIPQKELFERTGIFTAQYNTIYQLLSMKKSNDWQLDKADKILFIPDLLSYLLTGEVIAEYTQATTSQLVNINKKDWDYEVIKKLGLPERVFPKLTNPGTIIGKLKKELADELIIERIPVVAVASHDTASAIAAVPAEDDNFIYISTGTWIMVGVETDVPLTGEKALAYNFTNEGGVGGKSDFHKNVMGLWIIQECKRQWEKEGKNFAFSELVTMARDTDSASFINPDDNIFFAPGDMQSRIKDFCKKTGQKVPETAGEIIRCVEDSLAMKIRQNIGYIEEIRNRKVDAINMFGGGIQDELLCQSVADYTGKKVLAGPVEATAIGNVLMQAIALGKIKDIKQARTIVRKSFNIKEYLPDRDNNIEKLYGQFLKYN